MFKRVVFYKDHAQFDLLSKSSFANGYLIFQAIKYSYNNSTVILKS